MQVNIISLKYAEMCVNLFILQKNILCLKVACFVLLDLTESLKRLTNSCPHVSDTFQLFQYCLSQFFLKLMVFTSKLLYIHPCLWDFIFFLQD